MTCCTPRFAPPFLALALALLLTSPAAAGDSQFQGAFGASFFSASPACPAKRFPTFENLAPIPNIIDPFEEDLIPLFCDVHVFRDGSGVKNARGKFETELIVIDNETGQATRHMMGSGTFKTNKEGRAGFDFELPAEIFADGFESGDVSAWSYTRSDFTNRKRADSAQVACQTGSSRSN